jgi:ribosome biogenesis GTPase
MRGKIIKGIAGFYYVHDGHSRIYECKAKGIFRNRKVKPLVGDNVEFDVLDAEMSVGNITDILPRESELIRPAVANIDQCLIVFAFRDPEPNFHLLDRFLITMERNQIPVTLVFNKQDLVDPETAMKQMKSYFVGTDYPILGISTYSGEGIDRVREQLLGKTTVLAGPSGVGKSSLINYLLPDAAMETGEISEKIKRGRHTTRHSELFWLEEETFIFDTPGFSTIYLDEVETEDLRFYFPEINRFEGQCRFLGCIHDREPGCQVKQAVSEGRISSERYEHYLSYIQECKSRRKY